uniref:MYND-type domain-containing protein n=1 Tax=Mycena chlorophos TaxID=658473 RepID=A0ABQ0M422_MYCCL|nr:predicted protein [Mycena chlorophos]
MTSLHKSIHPDKLQALPYDMRKLLTAVCGTKPTKLDISRTARLLDQNRHRGDNDRFAPALYDMLDAKRIPATSDAVERVVEDEADLTLSVALLGLQEIYSIQLPSEANEAVWRRVWAWVHFLTSHHEQVARRVPRSLNDLCNDFIQYTNRTLLSDAPDTNGRNFFASFPGFNAVLFRTWEPMVAKPDHSNNGINLYSQLTNFTRSFDSTHINRQMLDDMISGTGGTIGDLGRVLTLHTRATANAPLAFGMDFHADEILRIIRSVNRLVKAPAPDELTPLCEALVSNKFHVILLHLMDVVTRSPGIGFQATPEHPIGFIDRVLKSGLALLTQLLSVPFIYPSRLLACLRAGMLSEIVYFARRADGEVLHHESCAFLDNVLVPATVYYSVLNSVRHTLDMSEDDLWSPAGFTHEKFRASWSRLLAVLERRSALKAQFDEREVSQSACDNVSCSKIQAKSLFRRCAACCSSRYCSVECQKEDWKDGGHRNTCMAYKGLRTDLDSTFGRRDVAFMRFIAQSLYNAARETISEQRALVPIESTTLTLINEAGGGEAQAQVVAVTDELIDELRPHDPLLEDKIARAKKSGGRITFCVLRLDLDGKHEPNRLVVPIRVEE